MPRATAGPSGSDRRFPCVRHHWKRRAGRIMSAEDRHRLAVAAADKEAAAFELDHAELNLQEAIVVALEHGEDPEVIAEVVDLEPEKVLELKGSADQPPLPSLEDLFPVAPDTALPGSVPDAS